MRRFDVLATLLAAALTLMSVMFSTPGTGALFTADYPEVVTLSAGQIFPAERVTPAFSVSDHSSGGASDVSSPVAFAGDALTLSTSAWPAAFDAGRYVELRFNGALPGNVDLTAASFNLSWASASGAACLHFELRDQFANLVDSEGTTGAPLSCTSSATPVGLVTPLPGVVNTDDVNAGALRMFVSSSGAAATVLDQAVVKVTYNAVQYTLYPIDVVDSADGSPSLYHWGLAGP